MLQSRCDAQKWENLRKKRCVGVLMSLQNMLKTIYIQQATHQFSSGIKCAGCKRLIHLHERAVKDEYGIYCNEVCFEKDIDEELRNPKKEAGKYQLPNPKLS